MRRLGMTKYWRPACLLLATGVLLAGCGNEAGNRMSGGTAGGAATGATFGLIGGPIGVAIGAGIGAGIGALTAANTTPKQINLGNPPWASGGGTPASASAGGTSGNPNQLRNQIDQYQSQQSQAGQPQPLTPSGGAGYSTGSVQSQPLNAPGS